MPVTREGGAGEPCAKALHAAPAGAPLHPVPARSFKTAARHAAIVAPRTSLQQATAFLLFAIVAAITPGPSNAMLTATGALAGMLRGLPCLLGVAAGMGLMMFSAGIGLAGLMVGHPAVLVGLKAGGSAFLLWLAWKIARAPYRDPQVAAQVTNRAVGFPGAFAFQCLNPKSWLVSVGAASAHLRPDTGVLAQALWIAGLFFAVALACGLVWLGFGVLVRRLLGSPRLQRAFNVAMGLLLALSTIFVL